MFSGVYLHCDYLMLLLHIVVWCRRSVVVFITYQIVVDILRSTRCSITL
jgi:hypothetical protein